jgi:hypothetical protein
MSVPYLSAEWRAASRVPRPASRAKTPNAERRAPNNFPASSAGKGGGR